MIRIEIEAEDVSELQSQLADLLLGLPGPDAEPATAPMIDATAEPADITVEPELPPSQPADASASAAPAASESAPAASSADAPAQPKKRGRPRKADAIPPVSANAPEPADGAGVSVPQDPTPDASTAVGTTSTAPETSPSAPSAASDEAVLTPAEMARNALRAYSKANSYEEAEELLAKFGAAKISDLKPEQIGDFLAACR